MIYIYAMNLNVDGVINPNLSLVQDIPAVHGMHLMNPNLKLGIESSGSFDFTVQPDDYFYDMFAQLKTLIRIDIDDENFFFGRVLTIETGFFGERKIACEGAISFLLDTYYPPVVEKNRTPISIYDYLMKVLDNHNTQCENDRIKAFNAGEIPGKYSAGVHEDQKISNEEYEFGASNWTQTKSVLDDLKSHYGGCWRTRFVNNNLFLDWFDQYFTDQINDQKIEIGKNLITASESTEVDNIFTRVIAVGKNDNKDIYLTGYSPSTITGESWTFSGNYFDVSDLTKVYTDQELSTGYHDVSDYRDSMTRYGLIWKIVSFDEANTQEKLFKAATKWVKDNYHGTIEKIQVTAIDMNLIGENISKIHVGDRVWLRFPYGKGTNPPIVERLLTCLEINYDLYNPENTSFSFGIPSMALTKNQRSSGKSTKQKASTPYTDTNPDVDEPKNDFNKWLDTIKNWMKSHQVWYKHNIVNGKPKEGGPSLIIDSAGKSHKPYFWIYDIEMGDDGKSKVWLWHPRIGTVYNNGRNVTWVLDSEGHPIGNWVKTKGSDFTYSLINQLRLLDYIQYEYGTNLQTDLSVKMPAVVADEDGNIDIFSNLFGSDGQGDTLLGKVVSFIADKTGLKADVLNVFNSDGLNIAKLLMEDGTYQFAALDEEGNIMTDDDGNVIFLDNRQIYHATQELAYTLEQMGVTVTLLDDQVTIIGQKVGDDTFGLVYDLAKMGIAVTTLTSEVNIIGDVVGDNTTGLVYDLAKMGISVNALGNDVNIIGNKVGDETRGLVYDLAKMGITVSTLSNDVNVIGDVVGDNTTGLVYDLAKMGISVKALGNDVNIIGNKVGDETRGLVYDLAKMGITVSTLSNDVNVIGDVVGDNTTGLVYDLAKMGISVNALGNDVNIIGNKVGDETRGLVYDLAKMGITVSALSNDVNVIGNVVGDNTTGLVYDLAKMGISVNALGNDVNIIGNKVGDETRGLVYDLAKMGITVGTLSNDVNIIGNVVGDNTTGLVYDLAKMGISVNALGNDVNIIGNKVGDETRGLVYDLAKMGISVNTLTNDVNIIGNVVGDNTTGLVYDLAKMGISVNALGNDVNIIGNKVGDNTCGLIYDLAKMGVTVSTLSSDVNIIGGKVGDDTKGIIYDLAKQGLSVTALTDDVTVIQGDLVAAKARISNLESDYISTDRLEAAISNIEQVNVKRLFINNGLTIKSGCQYIDWDGTTSGDSLRINRSDVKNLIKNVSITSATDTLRFTKMDETTALTISKSGDTLTFTDSSGNTLSFSKAASGNKVSGSWSGGVLTVSADASGEDSYQRYFKAGTITWASDKKHVTVYGDVYKQSGQSEYKTDSDAFSLNVDTTASYNAGRNFYLYSAGWSSTGKLTIGAKDGVTDDVISGKTIERTVTGGTPTWDGGTVTVPIRAYYGNTPPTYEDTNASISLNLSIDNNGNNSVKLKYGSTDTGYTFTHGKYTAGQKSVTPSISWPTGWTITASNPYDSTKTSSIDISMSHGSDSNSHYIELHSNETGSPTKAKKTIALDMGSVSSGSRTVKVRFDGSDILTSTINDYKNGQDSVHPTLSGSWSNGILTVSSSPSASDNYVRTLSQGTASWNGTTVSVPINVTYGNSGQYSESTGKSISVDVSGKLQSKSVTASTGTHTYTPDEGYIGFSSISVTTSGGDYSNVRTRFNAASGPSYYIEAYDQSTGNAIANTTANYKLGSVITKNGSYITSAKIQIQNTSGTQISSTPEFSIPLHTATVTPRASGTIYRPADNYIGLTKVTVNLSYSNWALELVSGTSYTYKVTARLNDENAEYTNSKISSGNLSAKGAYDNGRNSVKVKAFTSDARTQLNDHRTFTYTTDASSPPSDAAQEDTWYLAGGSSWSSGKTDVYLRYGSASGTSYAVLSVGPPPAGSIDKDVSSLPSGASSSGDIGYSKYIKIGSGYYSSDSYYKAPADRYSTGVADGKTAAGITTSWGTGSGANVLTVSRALSSSTKSATFTVTAENPTYSYNSSTHKYSLTGTALVNNSQKASGVSSTGTEAYDAGWSGCYGTVGLNDTTETTLAYGGSVTVYAQAKASSGASSKTNVASRIIRAPANNYDSGRTQGHNDVYRITTDDQANHFNDYWNARTYDSSGNLLKNVGANYTVNAGFFLPFADIEITANGRYLPENYMSPLNNVAHCFTGITVNVPNGGTTPSASNIDLNSWEYSSGKPSHIGTYTELTRLRELMMNYSRGYVYFKASGTGISGSKWYRIQTIN